jgi:hypothetical protein
LKATGNFTIVRRFVTLRLQHHDRASLLAGKLHAILQRPYPKGRDIYDLFWYLSDPNWPEPNLVLLRNALQQTVWAGPELNDENWRVLVAERIKIVDWDQILADLRPFIERETDLQMLVRENVLKVVEETGE